MAKNTIADLDTTASNNTDVLNQSTQGTAAVSTIDTMIQNSLGLLARFYADLGGLGTVGGTADAITLTTASTYQTLENGITLSFKAGSAITGASTINVDGLGVKAIRRIGDSATQAGDIVANGVYLLRYDTAYNSAAGAWILLNAGRGLATAAEYRTGTDISRALGVSETWASAAEVTLTDAATIAVDGATFLNAVVTLGGNRTLGTWSNPKAGQSGYIRVVQDATGSRTLAYHADYEFAGGAAPVLSTAANSQDMLFYQVIASGRILLSIVKGIS